MGPNLDPTRKLKKCKICGFYCSTATWFLGNDIVYLVHQECFCGQAEFGSEFVKSYVLHDPARNFIYSDPSEK